jgi:hypothetical protein
MTQEAIFGPFFATVFLTLLVWIIHVPSAHQFHHKQ